MPRIEFVNLSLNRLQTPILSPPSCTISNLRSLVLNNTKLNWYSVEELLKMLPSLEELHLSLNEYTHVLLDTIDEENGTNNSNNCDQMTTDECICDDEETQSLGSLEGSSKTLITDNRSQLFLFITLFDFASPPHTKAHHHHRHHHAAMDIVKLPMPMKAYASCI